MKYSVKIISADESEVIEFGDTQFNEEGEAEKDIISKVDIFFDSADDTRQKSESMLAKLSIEGNFSSMNTDKMIKLFNWSLEGSKDKIYRTVEIRIFENETPIRKYTFKYMFVVDYREMYGNNGQNEKAAFELKLNQQDGHLKTIDSVNLSD